jgi:methylglyoxal synthase
MRGCPPLRHAEVNNLLTKRFHWTGDGSSGIGDGSDVMSELSIMPRYRIALIAHDHCKADMEAWAEYNRSVLARHDLVATGTTGTLLRDKVGLNVQCLLSGPLGGDQQIGSLIAERKIDLLFFFWDALTPQPHDPDVKALLRLAVMLNVPTACNRSTADFLLTSSLMEDAYERQPPNFARPAATSRFD